MSTPSQELQQLLNDVVANADDIHAAFVYDLNNKTPLYKSAKVEGKSQLLHDSLFGGQTMANFGRLKIIEETAGKFGEDTKRGKFKYALFQFDDGILLMYFNKVRNTPVAIGFVNPTNTGLGNMVFFGDNKVGDIMDKLNQVLS